MIGLLYAGLSAVLSGSFAVLPKYASQKALHNQTPVPRPITAWWLALGFVCASSIWALIVQQAFSWWGLLSGLLWALSVVGRVASIECLGMCTGNAAPDVTAALTAWAYDAVWNKARFSCAPLGQLGFFLLALCLVSIYVLEQQGHLRRQLLARLRALDSSQALVGRQQETATAAAAGHLTATPEGVEDGTCAADSPAAVLSCPLLPARHTARPSAVADSEWGCISWGLLLGVVSGVCSGLSQLPFTLAGPGSGGIHFILASSLGMLLFATVNIYLHRLIWCRTGPGRVSSISLRRVAQIDLHTAAMAPYGVAGGMVLLLSMVCGILAGGDAAVDFSGAKVISQASVLVSGAWGVLLFHELRSLLQVLFWLLSLQMLCSYAIIIAGHLLTC